MSKNALFVLPAGLEPATLSLWVTCSNLTELKERLPGFEPGDIYTIEHYYTPHGGFVGIWDSNPVRNASPHQPNAFGLYPIDCLQNQKICMQLKPPRFQAWNTSWGNFFPFHFFPLLHCAPFSTPGVAKVYAPGISATCKLPVGLSYPKPAPASSPLLLLQALPLRWAGSLVRKAPSWFSWLIILIWLPLCYLFDLLRMFWIYSLSCLGELPNRPRFGL